MGWTTPSRGSASGLMEKAAGMMWRNDTERRTPEAKQAN
jgi:hypothetical protein